MDRKLHHLPPAELSAETRQLKLELGGDLRRLVETIEQEGFPDESTTYRFSNDEAMQDLWLPADLGIFVTAQATNVCSVDVCYDSHESDPRPRVAVIIYLANGERVTVIKDPSDLRQPDFTTEYSTNPETPQTLKSSEVGYLISSLVVPGSRRPDLSEAAMLLEHSTTGTIDPTDVMLARCISHLLALRADTWRREETLETALEDDNNTLAVTKRTRSDGTESHVVCFTQVDGAGRIFEGTATLDLLAGESVHQAAVSYFREWEEDNSQSGYGDAEPHLMDFMRSVIKAAQDSLVDTKRVISYEELSAKVIEDERFGRSDQFFLRPDDPDQL